MQRVRARHILTSDEESGRQLKQQLQRGAKFAELARKHSECPTGRYGGDLGEFGPGQMPPEVDQVVFNKPVGGIYGPVKSDRGFHLIEIIDRNDY